MKIKEIAPNGFLPVGYTRTRGVRLHLKVTNAETPDSQIDPDEVRSSVDSEPTNRKRLVDKNDGPVLALMSVPASKEQSKD
jgi:hypothetical protein